MISVPFAKGSVDLTEICTAVLKNSPWHMFISMTSRPSLATTAHVQKAGLPDELQDHIRLCTYKEWQPRDRSSAAQPISTRITQSRKKGPHTFADLWQTYVQAMFDNNQILLFWLSGKQTFHVLVHTLFTCSRKKNRYSIDLSIMLLEGGNINKRRKWFIIKQLKIKKTLSGLLLCVQNVFRYTLCLCYIF